MNSSSDDSDDPAMTDPVALEIASRSRVWSMVPGDQARGVLPNGPYEHTRFPDEPEVTVVRSRGTREYACERDPADVLRMWPHSIGVPEACAAPCTPAPAPAPSPSPSGKLCPNDKIVLAHLALDLYREIDDVQGDTCGTHPAQSDAAIACNNQGCEARINVLRGALVEACLLVQRVVMMTPGTKGEVDQRVRELLKLIEL
jgi:hypothetical protein